MRPVVVALVVTLAMGAAACGGDEDEPAPQASDEFCQAAIDLEEAFEEGETLEEQIELQLPIVRRLEEAAPAEIADEAQVFLDAFEAVAADPDNDELRDDPDVQTAVDDVNRYATDACALFERDESDSPL